MCHSLNIIPNYFKREILFFTLYPPSLAENSLQKTLQPGPTGVLPYLVNGHSVDIGVVHKPNDLVGEKLSVILWGQVRLSGFTGVQLKAFPDSLSQHIQSRISFHDLRHGLLDEGFYAREPVTKGTARKGENTVSSSPEFKIASLRIVGLSRYLSSPKKCMTSHKNVARHALVSPKLYVTRVENVTRRAIFFSQSSLWKFIRTSTKLTGTWVTFTEHFSYLWRL